MAGINIRVSTVRRSKTCRWQQQQRRLWKHSFIVPFYTVDNHCWLISVRANGCRNVSHQQRTGRVTQGVVCEVLVLLAVQTARPALKILLNHPMPSHSAFLIIICKALLAGKWSQWITCWKQMPRDAGLQQHRELSCESAEKCSRDPRVKAFLRRAGIPPWPSRRTAGNGTMEGLLRQPLQND